MVVVVDLHTCCECIQLSNPTAEAGARTPPVAPPGPTPPIDATLSAMEIHLVGSCSTAPTLQRLTHLEQLCGVTPSGVSIPARVRILESSAKENGLICSQPQESSTEVDTRSPLCAALLTLGFSVIVPAVPFQK